MNTLVMTSLRQHETASEWIPPTTRDLELRLVQSEKMSAAGQLLAGIVHELNNPLTTILGFSELLLRDGVADDGRLEKIHAEAARSVRIIQNVLKLARAGVADREIIDVNDSIRQTVELAEYQLRLNHIELNVNLSSKLPKVIAHEGELTQVLLNLVTNAVQAISGVRPSGKINISSAVIRDVVRISVTDDGPGISEPDVHRIFEPFFTTKETGNGLGLSLSRKLIRDNGGDMWLSSAEGRGTTFMIELPLVTWDMASEQEPASDDPLDAAKNRSVLIVDDEDHIAELIDDVMRGRGYRTERLNDGAPAIELLKKKDYDILICDLHMPGASGRDVLDWVRCNNKNTRVLLLSGDVVRNDTRDYAKSCGAHFLSKPFSVGELAKAVQKLFS